MKVRVIKPTRIERGKAGDIVEVSPDRARFLLRYGGAEAVTVRERIETPETALEMAKATTTAKKTTRKRKTS